MAQPSHHAERVVPAQSITSQPLVAFYTSLLSELGTTPLPISLDLYD